MKAPINIFEGLTCLGLRKDEFTEDNIEYRFRRHSTGQHLNIYLVNDEERLHVYYDTQWFHSTYEFNERGKKHGFLIDNAPWNSVLEKKFLEFFILIENKEERRAAAKKKIEDDLNRKESDKIERFKEIYK